MTARTHYPSLNSEGKFTLDKTTDGVGIDDQSFYTHIPTISDNDSLERHHIKKLSDDPTTYNRKTRMNSSFPTARRMAESYQLNEDNPAYLRDATEYPKFTDDTILVAKFAKEVTITFR